jgi:hypothetical protein
MRVAAILVALFGSPAALQAITVETVAVGNAGNPADPGNLLSRGAVGYAFNLSSPSLLRGQL